MSSQPDNHSTVAPGEPGGPRPVRLLLLALLIRLAILAVAGRLPERLLTPDSHDYLRLAHGLLESGTFGSLTQPEIFRVPGYPLWLAGILWIANSTVLVCLLQCFVDTGSCWLVYRLAKRLGGPRQAAAALFFQAVCVAAIAYTCRILSETCFTFLLLLFFDLLLGHLRPAVVQPGGPPSAFRRHLWPLAAAMVLAAAAYFRAVALPLALLPVLTLAWRRQLAAAGLFGLTFLLLTVPWNWRNARQADYPRFASVADLNLYRYNAAMLLARQQGRSFADQQAYIDAQFAALPNSTAVAEFARRQGALAIRQAPWQYAWLHLRSVPRNLLPAIGDLLDTVGVPPGPGGTLGVLQTDGLVAGVRHYLASRWEVLALAGPATVWLLATYVLAALGTAVLLAAPATRLPALLMLATIAYLVLVPGGAAHPRFRVPAMPLLAVLAAAGLAWLAERRLARYVVRFANQQPPVAALGAAESDHD